MKNPFLNISLLTAIMVMFYACEKDESEDGNSLNGKTTAQFNPDVTYGSMTDQDGNVYKTVTIGDQTWMAENLRTTRYNDGTDISHVTDSATWKNSGTGAYCNYNNTINEDTIATYGRLYNWHAVNTGMLAPAGWHVPTDDEWTELTNYLEGAEVAGNKLKETGNINWLYGNGSATNETGFTALPGGSRNHLGEFNYFGDYGYWWSSTEESSTNAIFRDIRYNDNGININNRAKIFGFSVRCIKD